MALNPFARMGFGSQQNISSNAPLPNGVSTGNNDPNSQQQMGQETQEEEALPFDPAFQEIYGGQEADDSFDLPQDLVKPPKLDANGQPIVEDVTNGGANDTTELQNQISERFKQVGMRLEDIPDDLDLSDKKQLHGFMNKVISASVRHAMAIMALPVNHAIQDVRTQMQSSLDTKMTESQILNKVQQAYRPIHEAFSADKDPSRRNYAKDQFQRNLSVVKDPVKAANATKAMIQSMWPDVRISKNLRSGNGPISYDVDGGEKTHLTGQAALDDLFTIR